MLENTEGPIKKYGQLRETGNIGYTRRRKTKQKHNKICVGLHYAYTHFGVFERIVSIYV
jgi:hypothetical protein